jgi:AcrR family transcriptional regulator
VNEPERRRGTSQERSVERRARMASAAIEILASHGMAGLTHRLVAAKAGVSLSATTYYFNTKHDIVAEASEITLRGYTDSFEDAGARIRAERAHSNTLRQFVRRLIRNTAHRDRTQAIAWAEIILDAHRHPQSLELARHWFAALGPLWGEIARAARSKDAGIVGHSAIDVVIGLMFMTVGLGLNEQQVDAALEGNGQPLDLWGLCTTKGPPPQAPVTPLTPKSADTRERILTATVDLLISAGVSAVTYRNIAAKAQLTPAAPFYHFPTVSSLLSAAQERLFEESKQRYRDGLSDRERKRPLSLEQLIDRTATVFQREVTQFGGKNLATYAIWLEAARNPELRPMVASAIVDQHLAWQRVLSRVIPSPRPVDALVAQAAYIGKILRILTTGSTMDDLSKERGEFAYELTALSRGRYWLCQNWYKRLK